MRNTTSYASASSFALRARLLERAMSRLCVTSIMTSWQTASLRPVASGSSESQQAISIGVPSARLMRASNSAGGCDALPASSRAWKELRSARGTSRSMLSLTDALSAPSEEPIPTILQACSLDPTMSRVSRLKRTIPTGVAPSASGIGAGGRFTVYGGRSACIVVFRSVDVGGVPRSGR